MTGRGKSTEPSTGVRRSARLAGEEVNEIGETSRRRNSQRRQTQQLGEQELVPREEMEYDRVSIHTWRSKSP